MKSRIVAVEDRLKSLSDGTIRSRFVELMKSSYNRTLETFKLARKPYFGSGTLYQRHSSKVYDVHWAGNNEDFVSISFDGRMLLWNVNDSHKDPRLNISLRSPWVMACAFEQVECRFVAAAGLDNVLSVYRIPEYFDQTGMATAHNIRLHTELAQHEKYISSIRFLDTSRIVSASGDSTLIVWDFATEKALSVMKGHKSDVMGVSVLPRNSKDTFASCSCDGTVRVWDLRAGNERGGQVQLIGSSSSGVGKRNRRRMGDLNALELFLGGTAVTTAGEDGYIRVFDLRMSENRTDEDSDHVITPQQSFEGSFLTPSKTAAPNAGSLWSGSLFGSSKTRSPRVRPSEMVSPAFMSVKSLFSSKNSTPNTSTVMPIQSSSGMSISVPEDGDGEGDEVDCAANDTRMPSSPQRSPVNSMVHSPSTSSSASLSPSRQGRRKQRNAIMDSLDGVPENSKAPIDRCEFKTFGLENNDKPVMSLAASRSGRVIFAGYEDGMLRAWDCTSHFNYEEALVQQHKQHLNRIVTLEMSPDGKRMISGSWDKGLKLYAMPEDLH